MKSSEGPDRAVVKMGDTVKVHYTCTLEDGSVFATTRGKEPIEFDVGEADVILGLQEAVIGMSPGDARSVTIPPEKAYGPYHDEMTATIDRSAVPSDLEIEEGVSLRVQHADGHESDAFVTRLTDTTVELTGNHPLAGKKLTLDLELVDVIA